MGKYFTVGELAKLHKFSRQTLIFYDKIGVLKPDYVDPHNGYRYYSAEQLEILDLLYTLKEAGVSLKEMKTFMENRSVSAAIELFSERISELERKINRQKKIKNRLEAKVAELNKAKTVENVDFENRKFQVYYENIKEKYIFRQEVTPPFSSVEIDVAVKNLFENARKKSVDHNYQLITSIPIERIKNGEFTKVLEACTAIDRDEYLRIRKDFPKEKHLVGKIPKGKYAVCYHKGPYRDIGQTYVRALGTIVNEGLKVCEIAYEESVIDCMTSQDENNYLTKIIIQIKDENKNEL